MGYLNNVRSPSKGLIMIRGRFEGDGTLISGGTDDGIVSVSSPSTSVYTVTLRDYAAAELCEVFTQACANTVAGVEQYDVTLDRDGSSVTSLLLTSVEAGTVTDLGSDEFCNLLVFLKLSD